MPSEPQLEHPWNSSWLLPSFFGHTVIFFFFFSPPYELVLPDQPLMGLLKLWELLQIFAVLMKAPKRN